MAVRFSTNGHYKQRGFQLGAKEEYVDFAIPSGWFDANHAGDFKWTPNRREWVRQLWATGIWWLQKPYMHPKSNVIPPITPGAALCARQKSEARPAFERFSYEVPDLFEGIAIDHPLACPDFTDWAVPMFASSICGLRGIPHIDLALAIAHVLHMTHAEMQKNPSHPRSGVGSPSVQVVGMAIHGMSDAQFHTLATSPEIWTSAERPPPLTWYAIMGALAVQLRWRMRPFRAALSTNDAAPAIREFAIGTAHPVCWSQAEWDLLRSLPREFDQFASLFEVQVYSRMTKSALLEAASHAGAEISGTTFDKIRKAAKVASPGPGNKGTTHVYSGSEVRAMIQAAGTEHFRKGRKVAEAWRDLLNCSATPI